MSTIQPEASACRVAVNVVSIAASNYYFTKDLTTTKTNHKLLVAASSYLNTAPLIWSFKQGTGRNAVELVEAVPARCAELLARGQVEVALVPTIEYQRIPDLTVVPKVCIASREEVRSVILVSKRDELTDIRKIALDKSSRTSATLVKIIFREFQGFEPEWVSAAPDVKQMLVDNDAALIIGDPAMTLARHGLKIFDMASLWRRHTGLGFVFAMWMVGPNVSREAHTIDFEAVCEEGLAHTDEIIDFYQPVLGLGRDELQTYLRHNISFSMDDELHAGLNLFYQLAAKHTLIPALKPLSFAGI